MVVFGELFPLFSSVEASSGAWEAEIARRRLEWPAIRNEIAARIAPTVCPVKRAVANIPPAAPLRESGADVGVRRTVVADGRACDGAARSVNLGTEKRIQTKLLPSRRRRRVAFLRLEGLQEIVDIRIVVRRRYRNDRNVVVLPPTRLFGRPHAVRRHESVVRNAHSTARQSRQQAHPQSR